MRRAALMSKPTANDLLFFVFHLSCFQKLRFVSEIKITKKGRPFTSFYET